MAWVLPIASGLPKPAVQWYPRETFDADDQPLNAPLVVDPVRLAALDAYSILDTVPEEGFDDIAQLAALACATPVALVSLVTGDRQWFKARVDFPACETDLNSSVCQYALAEPDLLVIPDLTADPRTARNPLVIDDPHIRFYAGAPLRTPEGQVLGSLCVIDKKARPKGLTTEQAENLRRCARQVMAMLALRKSEAVARQNVQRVQLALAAGAIIGTWFWDIPNDRFTVDEAFAQSFGLDPALGREGIPLADIVATVHPDDRAGLAQAIDGAITRGGAYAHQYRVRRRDGRYYWIEANGRVDKADDGTPLSFPGVLLDIEDRRAAEAALQTAETRLQLALTASGAVGLWDWMVDTDLLHGDAHFARLYGLDPAQTAAGITMEQYQVYVVPEDIAPLRKAIRETFDHAAPFRVEYRLAIPDQALRWVECKGQLIHDGNGQAVRFSGTAVDISERKAAEALLADSEAHWRGLFERLSEGFIVGEVVRGSDGAITDWRYVDVNRAWGELVGIDPATVIGRTIRQVFPGIEDAWVDEFADVVRTGRGIAFTRQVGTLARWYEGRAFALGPERFGVIFLDVTERLQASRRRDALLRLGEVLRDATTRSEIAAAAAEIAGTTLDLSRAGYGSVDAGREEITVEQDWALPGLDSIAGPHAFRTYGSYIELLKRGEAVIIGDTARDPLTAATADALLQVQTRALVNLPITEHGQFVALFFFLAAEPREWSESELSFIRSVADRTRSAVARIEAEERQDLLNRELSHRLKNTLAVVQSIASQTLRGVSEREVVETYEQRIIALSRAHDVLLQGNYAAASLKTVIGTVLGLLAPKDQLTIEGEDCPSSDDLRRFAVLRNGGSGPPWLRG